MTFQSDFKTPSDFLESKLHNRLKIPTKIRVKDLKLLNFVCQSTIFSQCIWSLTSLRSPLFSYLSSELFHILQMYMRVSVFFKSGAVCPFNINIVSNCEDSNNNWGGDVEASERDRATGGEREGAKRSGCSASLR